ncbi:hypothetical protein ACLB2K_061485 [Fragaria x ananassa]
MEQRVYPKRYSKTLAETVTSLEELLTEILLRVPAKPLLRFKCVSKHWLSLISDPKFCHRHTLQNPNSSISAVFRHSSKNFSFISIPPDHDPSGHDHISARWNPLSVIANQYGDIDIIHSCNGLFLCCPHGKKNKKTGISACFVLNPTTNQFLTLAIPRAEPSYIMGCSLAFDPSKSPHYKVIIIDSIYGVVECQQYKILIYSSETRTWRLLDSIFNMNHRIDYIHGVYWNGAIHWIGLFCEISYYHVDEERVKFVKSTPHCYQKKWQDREYSYFKESSGGHLHLIDMYKPCLTKFEVLEMGRDYSGWFVKYNVDLDPLCTSFSTGFRYGVYFVLFLERVENEEEDSSSLFLHIPGQVVSWNLKSKTFKSFQLTNDQDFLVEENNYLYKETLACV